jgi:hypothetical protein
MTRAMKLRGSLKALLPRQERVDVGAHPPEPAPFACWHGQPSRRQTTTYPFQGPWLRVLRGVSSGYAPRAQLLALYSATFPSPTSDKVSTSVTDPASGGGSKMVLLAPNSTPSGVYTKEPHPLRFGQWAMPCGLLEHRILLLRVTV